MQWGHYSRKCQLCWIQQMRSGTDSATCCLILVRKRLIMYGAFTKINNRKKGKTGVFKPGAISPGTSSICDVREFYLVKGHMLGARARRCGQALRKIYRANVCILQMWCQRLARQRQLGKRKQTQERNEGRNLMATHSSGCIFKCTAAMKFVWCTLLWRIVIFVVMFHIICTSILIYINSVVPNKVTSKNILLRITFV